MTHLPEEVVLDLLPVYFAGEASAASVALVERYFEAHPQFAETMRAANDSSPQVPGNAAAGSGHAAIERVRTELRWRTALIAVAIFCTVAPFTFVFDDRHVVFFMWRDAPVSAAVYAGAGALAWIALALLVRRSRSV